MIGLEKNWLVHRTKRRIRMKLFLVFSIFLAILCEFRNNKMKGEKGVNLWDNNKMRRLYTREL